MNCPSCASELPSPKFKFCPFCGAATAVPAASVPTVAAAAVSPAASETPAPAPRRSRSIPPKGAAAKETVVQSASRPAIRDTIEESPSKTGSSSRRAPAVSDTIADPIPAVRATGSKPATGKRPVDSEAATVFEMPAVDPVVLHDAMAKKHESHRAMAVGPTTGEIERAGRSKPSRATAEDDKPTAVNLPAITDADLPPISASATRAAAGRGPARSVSRPPAPVVAAPAPPSKKKFSETAWFMAAVNPAQLADAEVVTGNYIDVDVMADRYSGTDPVPDEVRKDFSLADDAAKGGKKKK